MIPTIKKQHLISLAIISGIIFLIATSQKRPEYKYQGNILSQLSHKISEGNDSTATINNKTIATAGTKPNHHKNKVSTIFSQPKEQKAKLTAYLSGEQAGTIGLYDGRQADNPADNIFTVKINYQTTVNDRIWLSYRLTGLADKSNVACSVNDRLAFGGYFAQKDSQTTLQRVQLNPLWLHKGVNRIQFGLPESATFGYKVSDLSIEVEECTNTSPLVVNTGYSLYNGKAYIHGFIQEENTDNTTIIIEGKTIALRDGEFETIIALTDKQEATIRATVNGKLYTKTVHFKDNTKPDNEFTMNNNTEKTSGIFVKGKVNVLQTENSQLTTDDKALLATRALSVTTLRDIDLPALDMAMTNVTDGHKGFRFLPHGEHFTQEGATVALKYDRTKIPDGYTENDIRSFYFDMDKKHWVALERDSVDKTLCMVVSRTTHFTDMINGVIKAPESPETEGFAPTMMNDIKAADPASKIQLIAPPTANNQGSANLSYNLELPPARNGMNPQLAITYNSDGGSGWLGEGWDLNIPEIRVDTRWGVPRYNSNYESETYLFNGEMLATTINDPQRNESDICVVNLAHRGIQYERNKDNPERQFHLRNESEFSQIIRKGNDPSNYYWVVTDKNGVEYTYGNNNNSELKGNFTNVNDQSKIVEAEWKLYKVKELHQDEMYYHYSPSDQTISDGVTTKGLYLDSITIGNYETIIFRSTTLKEKKTINARYGFLTSQNKLLDEIEIRFLGSKIRSYAFSYKQGDFNTTLLKSITHKDNTDSIIAIHTLDYFETNPYSEQYKLFKSNNFSNSDVKQTNKAFAGSFDFLTSILPKELKKYQQNLNGLNPLLDLPALGGTETAAYGASIYVGLGPVFDPTTSNTIGYSRGLYTTQSNAVSTIIDINGDGLPDKIYKNNQNHILFRPNLGITNGEEITYGNEITINGAPDIFTSTKSNTYTKGWRAVKIFGCLNGGYEKSTTYSNTQTYFADVNNDGLIDIVNNHKVLFNTISHYENGIAVPSFTEFSSKTPNPICYIKTVTEDNAFIESPALPINKTANWITKQENDALAAAPMQDIVRVWEAPYNGTINIYAPVMVVPLKSNEVPENINNLNLYVNIQKGNNSPLWSKILEFEDTILYTPALSPISVQEGEKIYFRVQCGNTKTANGEFDRVIWNPEISYVTNDFCIDENGYQSNVFKASDGFIVNKIGYNLIDSNAVNIHVTGNFTKPVTSSDINLKVYLANDSILYKDSFITTDSIVSVGYANANYQNDLVYSSTISYDDSINSDLSFNIINDFKGRYLRFEISSETNVCWNRIKWNPKIEYTANQRDTIVYAGVKYNMFTKRLNNTPYSGEISLDSYDDSIVFVPTFDLPEQPLVNTSIMMLLRRVRDKQIIFKHKIEIVDGIVQPSSIFKISGYIPQPFNETFTIEYYIADDSYAEETWYNSGLDITLMGFIPAKKVFMHRKYFDNNFGPMWRGWGQFEYNADGDRWNNPIDESKLFLPTDTADIGLEKMGLFCLDPDHKYKNCWRGLNDYIYINGDTMSTGRLNPLYMVSIEDQMSDRYRVPEHTIEYDNLTDDSKVYKITDAPILSTTYENEGGWGGCGANFGIFGISENVSKFEGKGTMTMGYIDMNGDGYPDHITNAQIEYSNPRGGRDGEKITIENGEITENSSFSIASSVQGSYSPNSCKPEESAHQIGLVSTETNKNSIYLSADINLHQKNVDYSTIMYYDINGDGLPDKIVKLGPNNIKVYLNLGFGFSNAVDFGIKEMQGGKTESSVVSGAGAGYDFAGYFSIGLNVSASKSMSLYKFIDMNGDGLPDEVYVGEGEDEDSIFVAFNKGNGFSDPISFHKFIDTKILESKTIGINASGSVIIPIPIIYIKVVTTGSLFGNLTITRNLSEMMDIDGDGMTDILASSDQSNNIMKVYRSSIGCTNKLKAVANPLGGAFTLEYERSKPTYAQPGGKWVMNSVSIHDGIINDGSEYMKNEFIYSGGKYDRREQEFLGFANVKIKNKSTESTINIDRIITQVYDTSSYYFRGKLLSTIISDLEGNPFKKENENYYSYQVSRKTSGNYSIKSGTPSEQSIIYAPRKYTGSMLFANNDSLITAETFSEYNIENGNHGELTCFKYSDSGLLKNDTSKFNYKTNIEYTSSPDASIYVYGLPCKVTVRGNKGELFRRIRGDWNTNSKHLVKISQAINENDSAVTDIEYDSRGNILHISYPLNSSGDRMSYSYVYDNVIKMYPVQITDAFGYTSRMDDYDYRYGIARKITDVNGNEKRISVDNLGRITSITGPNEVAAGLASGTNPHYTIKFEYNPQNLMKNSNGTIKDPAYAITRHYDPAHPNDDIETVTFIDGFGRVVQVKKDGIINGDEKMIVSGMTKYDPFGRIVEAYYPVTEDTISKLIFNTQSDSSLYKVSTTYDVLDRTLSVTQPDNITTTSSYGIENNLLVNMVTDALENKSITYTNGSGLTMKTVQRPDSAAIVTLFEYDAINQSVKITDDAGKTTESEYDWLGRRTQVKHPVSGETKFVYDAAGNLLAKQTGNLIKTGDSIFYEYDFNRLWAIKYPHHPENNVIYTYGSATDNSGFNRKGRLVSQEDGSGRQEFKYGRQGELTEVSRTLVIPNQAVATYTTRWDYDCWNRLQSMTYPDGEEVKYGYITGGLLNHVVGGKGGDSTIYVDDIRYDKFEQRSYFKYGNGTETSYSYNPQNRLLNTLSVQKGTVSLMNNQYNYDAVHNITSVVNSGVPGNTIGGSMTHRYYYDDLYRLDSASGDFIGNNDKKARYSLSMSYDKLHNITHKKQDIVQNGIKFGGILNAGYDLSYTYADNSQQIANIADQTYRVERPSTALYQTGSQSGDPISSKTKSYIYDANGNMTFVATGKLQEDSTLQATSTRQMLWDEENRLLALSDNGFVSNYWYDASGERTVKLSGESEGVFINGVLSAGHTSTGRFTAYISPYLVVNNGGYYSKHIYMGSQRITSKLGSSDIFRDSINPIAPTNPQNVAMSAKLSTLTGKIHERYDSLGVTYRVTSNGSAGLITSDAGKISVPELYFYHPDHLGSSSLITNVNGDLVQHIQYVPFGEVFVEETKSTWSTPYKFNAKELDDETGLYYYGARYYDPKTSVWLSVDPLAEKYPNVGSYVYCVNNPVNMIDPDGRDAIYIAFPKYRANGIPFTGHAGALLIDKKTGLTKYYEYGRYDKEGKGLVRTVAVSNVVIGKDGKPTTESLNKVMKQLSDKAGHGGDIEGAYVISDKFKEMNDYAKSKMAENSDPNRKEYTKTGNNCATFAEDVITQDKSVDKPGSVVNSPVNIVNEYQEEGNAKVQYQAKTQTTTIGTGNEKDAKVKVKK